MTTSGAGSRDLNLPEILEHLRVLMVIYPPLKKDATERRMAGCGEDLDCMAYILSATFVKWKMDEKKLEWLGAPQLGEMSDVTARCMVEFRLFDAEFEKEMEKLCERRVWNERSSYRDFMKIGLELIEGEKDWGKVVAVFVFGGCLAAYCASNGKPLLVGSCSDWGSAFCETHLDAWVQEQGGFSNIVRPEEGYEMNDLWDYDPRAVLTRYVEHRIDAERLEWANAPEMMEMKLIEFGVILAVKKFDNMFSANLKEDVEELNWGEEMGYKDFEAGVREMMKLRISWERIAAVYVFGAYLAMYFVRENMAGMVSNVIDWMVKFTENDLKTWMINNGGFAGLVAHFTL